MIVASHGDLTFRELLAKMRCEQCGQRPAPVYLVAGHHRKYAYGPPTCWALELVRVPDQPRYVPS